MVNTRYGQAMWGNTDLYVKESYESIKRILGASELIAGKLWGPKSDLKSKIKRN